MTIDEELKLAGMQALQDALGDVQADRFIALMLRAPFDYTKWQRKLWSNRSVDDISSAAMELRREQ